MTLATTYPGVYVQEIASGVHTITGVATSIAAFVGRARSGPVNTAITINGFGEFEQRFGGLWNESTLGFAVRDFFSNGGTQAIVVRLYRGPGEGGAAATASIEVGGLDFEAANEGKWGANLRVLIDADNVSRETATELGVAVSDLFNLTVRDAATGQVERFLNVTVVEGPRRIDRVLASSSALLAYVGSPASDALDAFKSKLVPYAAAQKALADKLRANPNADVSAERTAVTQAKTALDTVRLDPVSLAEQKYLDAKKLLEEKQNAAPNADTTAEKAAVVAALAALESAVRDAEGAVSDGGWLTVADFLPSGGETSKKGLYALEQADLFNLLCIPPYRAPTDTIDVDPNLVAAAAAYAERRRAMMLLDAPKTWTTKEKAVTEFVDASEDHVGTRSANAALFFPRLRAPNPLRDNQIETFSAIGTVAGVFARTDAQRGVWKAPAGMEAALNGVPQLALSLTDQENGQLNPLGVNCLRGFPGSGRVVWGARTLRGADQLASEWKYIPVRRTALFIEESLYRGLKWAVFEPNDEPLWAQIRLNVGAFMHGLFRQQAFQGTSPRDAYFVRCDKETTTQADVNLGIVNVIVGFAPLKPAEFVIVKIQQMAGQIEV